MHDPKFEQEVQRKMHDLEFIPSDSVWAGIQQGIAPRERRRAVAVLWWLFPGMLLLAGGIVMYRHLASTDRVAVSSPVRGGNGGSAGSGVAGGGGGNARGGGAIGEGGSAGSGSSGAIGGTSAGSGSGVAVGGTSAGSGDERGVDGRTGNVEGARADRSARNGDGSARSGDGTAGRGDIAGRENILTEGRDERGAEVGGGGNGSGAVKRALGERFHPGLIGGLGSRAEVTAPNLYFRPVKTAVSGIGRQRHPWTAGFAAGGGVSSVYSSTGNALVGGGAPQYVSAAAAAPSNTYNTFSRANFGAYGPAASSSKRTSTNVATGYSYWAGIYGEKALSSRWLVDIGLNLHYYSVLLQTESQVISYAPTSASLIAPSAYTYSRDSSSSSTVSRQTYTNSYYFLEVPVSVEWKVNHSRSLPLFWRGGVVLSYLMSSNGLYYDSPSGTYKKDNGVVRRAQVGLNSGLMLGLPVKGVRIQAGPEVQYGLTSMLSSGSGGGHMLYGGMRVALMR